MCHLTECNEKALSPPPEWNVILIFLATSLSFTTIFIPEQFSLFDSILFFLFTSTQSGFRAELALSKRRVRVFTIYFARRIAKSIFHFIDIEKIKRNRWKRGKSGAHDTRCPNTNATHTHHRYKWKTLFTCAIFMNVRASYAGGQRLSPGGLCVREINLWLKLPEIYRYPIRRT